MPNHTTEALSERDIAKLAAMMADNIDVFDRLADAVAEKLGEKLYARGWDTAGIDDKLDTILAKLNEHDRRFDTVDRQFETIENNLQAFSEKQGMFERKTERTLKRIKNRVEGLS